MTRPGPFGGCTVEFRVPDFGAGVDFYSGLFRRRPDFEPHHDFVEWEAFEGLWFQLAAGEPRPTYALRLRVEGIEAEIDRIQGTLGVRCSAVTRIAGLVAFCDFPDPWGNRLGLYERLFAGDAARVPGGSYHDWESAGPSPGGPGTPAAPPTG